MASTVASTSNTAALEDTAVVQQMAINEAARAVGAVRIIFISEVRKV